ncbi:hypothetical protein BVIET440_120051 [Burkholderia vietnamiensis]
MLPRSTDLHLLRDKAYDVLIRKFGNIRLNREVGGAEILPPYAGESLRLSAITVRRWMEFHRIRSSSGTTLVGNLIESRE